MAENLNSPTIIKEIEFVTKNPPPRKSPGQDFSLLNLALKFKDEIMSLCHRFFRK